MQYQTVLEVYRKLSVHIENLKLRPAKGLHTRDYTLEELINELNWIRAELEMTREVNPEK